MYTHTTTTPASSPRLTNAAHERKPLARSITASLAGVLDASDPSATPTCGPELAPPGGCKLCPVGSRVPSFTPRSDGGRAVAWIT